MGRSDRDHDSVPWPSLLSVLDALMLDAEGTAEEVLSYAAKEIERWEPNDPTPHLLRAFAAAIMDERVLRVPRDVIAVDDLLGNDALDRMKAEQDRMVYPEPDNADGRAWARRILKAALDA